MHCSSEERASRIRSSEGIILRVDFSADKTRENKAIRKKLNDSARNGPLLLMVKSGIATTINVGAITVLIEGRFFSGISGTCICMPASVV